MSRPLFHSAFGTALATLPAPVVLVHDVHSDRSWQGRANVEHGTSLLARLAVHLLRFPPAGRDQALSVAMRVTRQGEHWQRCFNGWPLDSALAAGPGGDEINERLWPVSALSRLSADAGSVTHRLIGLRLLGLPVPKALWPQLDVSESADGSRYTFRMRISDPGGRLIIAYDGWLETAETSTEG